MSVLPQYANDNFMKSSMSYKKAFALSCCANILLVTLLMLAFSLVVTEWHKQEMKVQFMTTTESIDASKGSEAAGPSPTPAASSSAAAPAAPAPAAQTPAASTAAMDPTAPATPEPVLPGFSSSSSSSSITGGTTGTGSTTGTGTGSEASGSNSGTGSGTGSGSSSGSGQGSGNSGYVDVDGYMARLNRMKQYPHQALARSITGAASFSVTFSADGEVTGVSLTSSSGSGILDKAAEKLIWSGERIDNTTGSPTTQTITINYQLE